MRKIIEKTILLLFGLLICNCCQNKKEENSRGLINTKVNGQYKNIDDKDFNVQINRLVNQLNTLGYKINNEYTEPCNLLNNNEIKFCKYVLDLEIIIYGYQTEEKSKKYYDLFSKYYVETDILPHELEHILTIPLDILSYRSKRYNMLGRRENYLLFISASCALTLHDWEKIQKAFIDDLDKEIIVCQCGRGCNYGKAPEVLKQHE
ncbi:MAG: hypothetical protein ACK5MD_01275 [Flavobacteriales bacterium]